MVNAAFHTAVGSSYEAAVQAEEDERLLGTQSPPPQLSLGERKKMNSSYLGEKVVFLNLRATAERLHTCTPDLCPGPQSGAAPVPLSVVCRDYPEVVALQVDVGLQEKRSQGPTPDPTEESWWIDFLLGFIYLFIFVIY